MANKLLHSWWLGVIIFVLVIVTITVYESRVGQVTSGVKTTQQTKVTNVAARSQSISYGIALGATLGSTNAEQHVKILSDIKKAGFTEVRTNLNWVDTEPVKGKYNWIINDEMMRLIKNSGLNMVALIDRAPEWARLSACSTEKVCSPANADDYAKFVAAAASRYKSYNIVAYEVWNEENGNNFWKPLPNPNQYAQLLKATYIAVKRADPEAVVLVGGLSGDSVDKLGAGLVDPRTFLAQLYAAGMQGYFDGIAYHPYVGNGLPSNTSDFNGWLKMNTGKNNIRNLMTANGDADKGIWITEFGVPTGGKGVTVTDPGRVPKKDDHVTLQAQSEIVQAAVDDLESMPWVKSFDWYTYRDGAGAATNKGAAYGIWQFDGKPKPALQILQKEMRAE